MYVGDWINLTTQLQSTKTVSIAFESQTRLIFTAEIHEDSLCDLLFQGIGDPSEERTDIKGVVTSNSFEVKRILDIYKRGMKS